MELKNRRVIITGASRGLGAALARGLAAKGAKLLLVARNAGPLAEVARATNAHAVTVDVGAPGGALAIAAAAQALLGGVDVVIHNASVLGPVPLKGLLDTTDDELEAALEVNLLGPFRLTRALAGAMALKGRGVVVHVTSDAATNVYPTWGAYGVSKAGLEHLGRIWAAELEGRGVQFITFDPGGMDTKMHADAMPDADPATLARPAVVAERLIAQLEGSS
ncbi:MAG: SDR family oxidoreductase [Myxococcaceae bacterium]|nr:SDR family oxidoreductase [Myxococcaceae bacterium]